MTSVSEVTSARSLSLSSQSSEASASLSVSTVACSLSSCSANNAVSSVSTVSKQSASTSGSPQSHSSCYTGPDTALSSDKCNAGPTMHMHYGSAPAYGYNQMIAKPLRMMGHPNVSCYHPSADYQARVSPSYHHMVTFAPHRMPYATSAGYSVYNRSPMHMGSSSWSGSMQLPRQCGVVYGPPPRAVSSTAQHQAVDFPSAVSDAQEPVQATSSTKSKKKAARNQSKESYSSILERSVPCPNIDVRQIIQEQRERLQMEAASCSVGVVHSLTAVWTMSTAALPATSASTSQHVVTISSESLPATSASFVVSIGDSMITASGSSLLAVPEVSCTCISLTTNVSVLSSQLSHADTSISGSSFLVVTAVSSASVSPTVSYATINTAETSASTALHKTPPIPSSVSCGANWVHTTAQQCSQYNHWSQYSSHPLSCTLATQSSAGMHPYQSQFHCSQGPQVLGIRPVHQLPPGMTATASAVANSACLPAGVELQSSVSDTVNDESPIRLVQNMVSGLQTTQNSLAIATSLIISQADCVPRRRRSVATEATGHIATNTPVTELCEEVRLNSEPLKANEHISSSVRLPDDSVGCIQTKPHLPTTSAVTTETSVLTQVLPAASVVPSAYCMHPLPSVSVHPSVSPVSATVSLCSDTAHTMNVTSTSSTNDVESIAVSCSSNACYDASASDGRTAQQLTDDQIVDDDESTQDCDVSIAGTDSGEVLCTTGTQTSTPASGVSNCNSVESGGDGSESNDTGGPMVSAADDALPAESLSDVVTCNVPAQKPSAAACEEKPADDVHPEHIPASTSTPVVLIPRVPQASFLLPQNIAFAPNPLVGHGFLQFQPPGEFGYGAAIQSSSAVGQPGALGLVHFATGPMVGPAVGNMMTTSDAGGSFRLMTPVKSDSDIYSAAEFLPIMPAAVPAGHILLQNIVPTGLASTIVPFVQPAALCSLTGGSSALFAVSQGSMMPVGTPLAFAPVPVPEQHHQPHDHAPDQPDSTVDNSEMDTTDEPSSDDSADTEQVTSTDEPLYEVSDHLMDSATKLASSIATTLHYSNSQGTHLSLTKTIQCNTLECSSNTAVSTEYDGDIAGASSASHPAAVHRSWSLMPSVKKRVQHGRSRLKKMCRGYDRSTLPSAAVDQMSCSSSQSSLNVPASIMMSASTQDAHSADALMSPTGSEESVDSFYCDFHVKDAAASDSSVSTTLLLHDGSNDGANLSIVDKCSYAAGSVRKARWKKQALARRTRLRLRQSKPELKPPADVRLSPAEITHAGE